MKKDLIDIFDLSTEDIDELIQTAFDIVENPQRYSKKCEGKRMGVLFYEPSTRTRLSFESAMYALGGNVLGFSDASTSSVSKGESVSDTARTVECFSDILVMRHPKEGAPFVASRNIDIPLINAGDGGHNHPTQTLTDLFTIMREKGRLNNMTIACCGDLKFGRTVHSLIGAMSRYENVKFLLVSPEELRVPEHIRSEILIKNNMEFEEITSLDLAIDQADVLYMTRVQKERFFNEEDYIRLKDSYILTPEILMKSKEDLSIMHPLPRVNEISVQIDSDPRAAYFRQVKNGRFIRMALVLKLLGL